MPPDLLCTSMITLTFVYELLTELDWSLEYCHQHPLSCSLLPSIAVRHPGLYVFFVYVLYVLKWNIDLFCLSASVNKVSTAFAVSVDNEMDFDSWQLNSTKQDIYDFITSSDRFQVPIKSAVKSYLTAWCDQKLSNRALNALTVLASTTEFGRLFKIFTLRA